MKKIIMILVFAVCLSFPSMILAQNWYITDQGTIEWDAVTVLGNGDPIPIGDIVQYQVYLCRYDEPKENAVPEGSPTDLTEYTFTLVNEGRYWVGVRALRTPQGETEAIPSPGIAWSDDPLVCESSETFGFKLYFSPIGAVGLRKP